MAHNAAMPTALVVDDSGASRTLLKGLLKQHGFTVHEATDGASGLAALAAQWPIDLVLLDWHMEPMAGPEFLRQVRDDPRTVGVPVIMITAEASRQAVVDASKLGVQGYVIKPFDKQMVAARIAALGLATNPG